MISLLRDANLLHKLQKPQPTASFVSISGVSKCAMQRTKYFPLTVPRDACDNPSNQVAFASLFYRQVTKAAEIKTSPEVMSAVGKADFHPGLQTLRLWS